MMMVVVVMMMMMLRMMGVRVLETPRGASCGVTVLGFARLGSADES